MILKLKDISIFIANCKNKADNIRTIQSILNIGFDSMVFIDDNPFERNIVRQNIPEICVPELPDDPAEYLNFIYTLNLFETVNITKDDFKRTVLYQNEAKRVATKKQYVNVDDYLKSLNVICDVSAFNKSNRSRVAQLSMRSNQFNLRTIRYDESSIKLLESQDSAYSFPSV